LRENLNGSARSAVIVGVRITSKTWYLMSHKIDPDVDEARSYLMWDLLDSALFLVSHEPTPYSEVQFFDWDFPPGGEQFRTELSPRNR
jgi:hypothetical protein